jgi:hypothetical protein
MRWSSLGVIVLLAVGCGHATRVRPTPQGKVELEATVGGPLAKVGGMVLPLPLSTVGAAYGFAERADVHAHLHGTTLAFGVAGLDVGSTYLAVQQNRWLPALSVTGRLYGFTDFQAFRPYLEVSGAASYFCAQRFLSYLSVSSLVQFDGLPLWAVGIGEEVKLGRVSLQLEGRWYQPHSKTRFMAVEWQGPGQLGAIGVLLGAKVLLGEEAR